MADYPATLPQPDHVNYSGTLDYGLVSTSVSSPQGNQRTIYNSPRSTISLQWSMDNATYLEWIAWVKANGWKWFTMELVSPAAPVEVTSTQYFRFSSPVQYSKNGDNWLTVSATLETMTGQPADPLAPDNPIDPAPPDPYPGYADIINALPTGPVTWIRGYRGVINEGSGLPANWIDYNGLPEPTIDSRGLITLGGIDNGTVIRERALLFPTNSTWLTNAADQWLYSGGRGLTQNDDVSAKAAGSAQNIAVWSATVQIPEQDADAPHVVGWPITYSLQSNNVYNLSTNPANPTVTPASGQYRIRLGTTSGTEIINQTVNAVGNSASNSLPEISDTIVWENIAAYIIMNVQSDFDLPAGSDPITTTCDFNVSVRNVTPRMGSLCPHEITATGSHTITLLFQYQKQTTLGVDIDQDQWLLYAGQIALIAEKTDGLRFYKNDATSYLIESLVVGNWYAVTLQQENLGNYALRAWVNGIEKLDITTGFEWNPTTDSNLYTGGSVLGTSSSALDKANGRKAVVQGIAEYTMFNYALTEQQIIDQHNALLS